METLHAYTPDLAPKIYAVQTYASKRHSPK